MNVTFPSRAPRARLHRLPDGRRITVREAVPSDAPRLAALSDAEPSGVIALDDHGDIVGRADGSSDTEVAGGWTGSALATVLERALDDPE